MQLYYHPRSPYSQKTLLALHEKGVAFTPKIVNPIEDRAVLAEVSPLGKVPVLVLDDGWKIPESSIIIEYLDAHFGGPRLIPEDRDRARQTRFHDRLADLYVTESTLQIFFDGQKPEARREPERVAAAHARLDALFAGFDQHLARRTWIMGDDFSMADCALLPSLGYCRQLHPFAAWKHLAAYASRGFERPAFEKATQR
jgi:glutathione S-transferase